MSTQITPSERFLRSFTLTFLAGAVILALCYSNSLWILIAVILWVELLFLTIERYSEKEDEVSSR